MKRSKPTSEPGSAHKRGPNFHIPFQLVYPATLNLQFSERTRPESPYRLAICQLLKPENADKALEFTSNTSARTLLAKHARELGVKLLFAEQGGMLYARLVAPAKVNRQILEFIREKPRTKNEIDAMVLNRHL